MKVTKLKAIAYKPDEVTLTFLGEDQQDFDLTVPSETLPDLFQHMMKQLNAAASAHPEAAAALRHKVHSIQAVSDESESKKGFHILTDRALELVLLFDQKQLARLNEQMFQYLTGDDDGPKVH